MSPSLYLFCGAAVTIVSIGVGAWWVVNNLERTADYLIGTVVDARFFVEDMFFSQKGEGEPEGAIAPVLKTPLNAIVYTERKWKFAIYNKFTGWGPAEEDTPAPPWSELYTNDPSTAEFKAFTIIRGHELLSLAQKEDLLYSLSELAGPDGNFNGNIPTTKVIAAYMDIDEDLLPTTLLVENEDMEEFLLAGDATGN